MRRLVAPALILFAVLLVASPPSVDAAGSHPSRHVRVELKEGSIQESCTPDGTCTTSAINVPVIRTPNVASVDVVVSLGTTYRTSTGAAGLLRLKIAPQGGPSSAMTPKQLRLDSLGRETSTTLTWFRDGVPANGRTLSFLLSANLVAGPGGSGTFEAKKLTLIVDIWPSGDR